MSITNTQMVVAEITCDHCGKKDSRSFIQDVSDDDLGTRSFPEWLSFYVNLSIGCRATQMDACSEACYTALCQKEYLAWEASLSK